MEKPRYRYNWKTEKWEELYRVECNTVMLGLINPDTGIRSTISTPMVEAYAAFNPRTGMPLARGFNYTGR